MGRLNFPEEFNNKINQLYPDGIEWGIVGILTKNGKGYYTPIQNMLNTG